MFFAHMEIDEGDDKQMLIVGLSKENIRRLQEGQPIVIRRGVHGEGVPKGWQITLLVGEPDEIARQFKEAGMIKPDTKINRDPRLGLSTDT